MKILKYDFNKKLNYKIIRKIVVVVVEAEIASSDEFSIRLAALRDEWKQRICSGHVLAINITQWKSFVMQ